MIAPRRGKKTERKAARSFKLFGCKTFDFSADFAAPDRWITIRRCFFAFLCPYDCLVQRARRFCLRAYFLLAFSRNAGVFFAGASAL